MKKRTRNKLIGLLLVLLTVTWQYVGLPYFESLNKPQATIESSTPPSYGGITKTSETSTSQSEPVRQDIQALALSPVPDVHYVELGPANFTEEEWAYVDEKHPYEFKGVDHLGRATKADAYLTKYNYRGSNGRGAIPVDPVGWNNPVLNNGERPYNRSHLLAYAFMDAEIDVQENLVTGLEEFNQSKDKGMQKFEKEVEYAVKSGFVVRYQVYPVYHETELVPRGVVMRYETKPHSLSKTVFVYNVQDNLVIDYQTGEIVQDNS